GAMIKKSAEFEQVEVAFTTFLGSADRAKVVLKELENFSIVTPFTIDQVNAGAKTLLAFGVEGEDLQDTLKILGDVSAGTGKDLKEMAVIFGQVKSTGKLMGQDLLQLINAGFNPLQEIARTTGQSVSKLKEDMSKGLISFDMVEDAFKSATSAGGLFNDMMAKQSKTLAGRMSTLSGNISLASRAMGDKMAPAVGFVVDALNDMIAPAKDGVTITKELTQANNDYEQALKDLDEALKGNSEVLVRNNQVRALIATSNLEKKVAELNTRYNELPNAIKKSEKQIAKINPLFSMFVDQAKKARDRMDRIKSGEEVFKGINDNMHNLSVNMKLAQERADELFNELTDAEGELADAKLERVNIEEELSRVLDKLSGRAKKLIDGELMKKAVATQEALKLADEEIKKKKELADAEKQRIKDEETARKKALASWKRWLSEFKKIIDGAFGLREDARERELDRQIAFLEKSKKTYKNNAQKLAEIEEAQALLRAERQKVIDEKAEQKAKEHRDKMIEILGYDPEAEKKKQDSDIDAEIDAEFDRIVGKTENKDDKLRSIMMGTQSFAKKIREEEINDNITFLEDQLQLYKDDAEMRKDIEQAIHDYKKQLMDQEIKDQAGRVGNALSEVAQFAGSLGDIAGDAMDNRMAMLDQEQEHLDQLLKDGAISEEEYAEASKENEEKIRAQKKKSAQADKAMAVFQALMSIPMGIARAIQQFGPPPSPLGISGIASATAIGTAQAVVAGTTPIPAFAKGGSLVTDGPQLFLAGDNPGGKERIDITPLEAGAVAEAPASGKTEFHFHGVENISEARNEMLRSEGEDAF
ncbi:tape measure protein, partial [Flavobacteriaceae bacterium]|nr:tape measure protein [Flavobacteriaceae bacterium]